MDWPLDEYGFDDLTFSYDPPELGLKPEEAAKVRTIHQLRPFRSSQPWGIFFVEFKKKNLPVVVLRRILRHLVLRKRASANAADAKRWQSRDLLFISAWGGGENREMTFAHFVDHPELGPAELRVLGWDDDDTPLKMDYVARRLGEKLRWRGEFAADPEAWRQQWSDAFVVRHRHVITKSTELATALAELAKRLRSRIRTILRMEDGYGEIRKLQGAFQTGLIHDLDGFSQGKLLGNLLLWVICCCAPSANPSEAGSTASHPPVARLELASANAKTLTAGNSSPSRREPFLRPATLDSTFG